MASRLGKAFHQAVLFKYCHEQPWTPIARLNKLDVSFASLITEAAVDRHKHVKNKVAKIRLQMRKESE